MTLAEDGVRRSGRRSVGIRTAVVWDSLGPVLAAGPLDVVDVGGGTGHFAVPLAELEHRVTVVDANPDALAALERRADEAGVIVIGRQADAHELLSVVDEAAADLVLCHSALEYVEDPAAVLAALVGALRPGGGLSVLVTGSLAAALHRAATGHFEDAQRALTRADGRWGEHDPVPHRFTRDSLLALATDAGLVDVRVTGSVSSPTSSPRASSTLTRTPPKPCAPWRPRQSSTPSSANWPPNSTSAPTGPPDDRPPLGIRLGRRRR